MPMSLLIVEDNEVMRRMIRSVVEDLAAQIFECGDGVEALPQYAERRPDWVLIDLRMHEMDGISATRQIRASYPDANIVVVTDYDDEEFRREAASAGAREYVLKENLLELRQLLIYSEVTGEG